jgi:20S proteasome subunit alpha 2
MVPAYTHAAAVAVAPLQALLTMREGFEGEMTEHNIELGIVGEDRKFRILTPAEVRDYLDEAL